MIIRVHFYQYYCLRGSVGRAVASDSKGPQFKSSLYQVINNEHLLSTVKTNKKEAEKDPPPYLCNGTISLYLFKKILSNFSYSSSYTPFKVKTPPQNGSLLSLLPLNSFYNIDLDLIPIPRIFYSLNAQPE